LILGTTLKYLLIVGSNLIKAYCSGIRASCGGVMFKITKIQSEAELF